MFKHQILCQSVDCDFALKHWKTNLQKEAALVVRCFYYMSGGG